MVFRLSTTIVYRSSFPFYKDALLQKGQKTIHDKETNTASEGKIQLLYSTELTITSPLDVSSLAPLHSSNW